jgi:hypothetical protein
LRFLVKKLNGKINPIVASYLIDHFCDEIQFLFLVAAQESSDSVSDIIDSESAGYSYVTWKHQQVLAKEIAKPQNRTEILPPKSDPGFLV